VFLIKRALALGCVLVITLWCLGADALDTDSWSDTINNAEFTQATGDLVAAEKLLQRAERQATSPYTKFATARLLGYLYRRQNRVQLALMELKRCLEMEHTYEYLGGAGTEDELAALYDKIGQTGDADSMRKAAKDSEQHHANDVRLCTPYITSLQDTIRRRWTPPAKKDAERIGQHWQTVCNWIVDRSGHFSSIHISQSSGDKTLDNAALAALRKIAFSPSPLPKNGPEYVEIQFSFTYNVLGPND